MNAIDRLTLVGNAELEQGNEEGALRALKSAYLLARKQNSDVSIINTSLINLASAYIAVHKTDQGIKLLKAILSKNAQSGLYFEAADVHYNLGLGYETVNRPIDALRHFELALTEYGHCSKHATGGERVKGSSSCMEAIVSCKLGLLNGALENHVDAARYFSKAGTLYKKAATAPADYERSAVCLLNEATHLSACNKHEEAITVVDDCLVLCQKQASDITCLGLTRTLYTRLFCNDLVIKLFFRTNSSDEGRNFLKRGGGFRGVSGTQFKRFCAQNIFMPYA